MSGGASVLFIEPVPQCHGPHGLYIPTARFVVPSKVGLGLSGGSIPSEEARLEPQGI